MFELVIPKGPVKIHIPNSSKYAVFPKHKTQLKYFIYIMFKRPFLSNLFFGV